jgi:Mrp family chromosome partitioning ATPase
MTRIFDALRKAQAERAGTHAAPPAPTPRPSPAAGHLAPVARAARPVPERGAAPVDAGRGIVPFDALVPLSPDVLRQMTGLRVSLETSLTQRIPRTVMFLSSQGGEGTSTVAAQFAQALADDGRLRVLLVDLHARRPAWTAEGGSEWPGADPAGRGAPVRNLDLMPLPDAVRGERMLDPDAVRALLDPVSSAYDWVVLDGPPVLDSPDAAPLSAVADGILVVVQAGRTKRPVLNRSVDLLGRGGGHVLGIVLNRRRLEIPEFIYRRI